MAKPDKIDTRSEAYLPHDMDLLEKEFREGKKVGESWGIKELDPILTYMRGFIYCHAGWPNSGKTTAKMFTSLVKGLKDGSRVVIYPDEQLSSIEVDGKIIRTANDVYDDLVHMLTSKCPYRHWKKKYNIDQMPWKEYQEAQEIIRDIVYVIDPENTKYDNVFDIIDWASDEFEADEIIIDPFSSLILESTGRSDRDLDFVLKAFRRLVQSKNAVGSIIAHGKNDKGMKNSDGSYKVVDKDSLLGGSAWNNNMDVIISYHRPCAHLPIKDPNFPLLTIINQKQRKQQLTNQTGEYDGIEFDFFKNRYYFNGICPIDGEVRNPKQGTIQYQGVWQSQPTTTTKNEPPF